MPAGGTGRRKRTGRPNLSADRRKRTKTGRNSVQNASARWRCPKKQAAKSDITHKVADVAGGVFVAHVDFLNENVNMDILFVSVIPIQPYIMSK